MDQHANIIDILSGSERPLSRDDILRALPRPMSTRTLMRRLNELIADKHVIAEGRARARQYRLGDRLAAVDQQPHLPNPSVLPGGIPVSEDGREAFLYITRPLAQRHPVGYDPDFLTAYVPNQTYYLGASARAHLRQLGVTTDRERPAGTYGRAVLDRLLIDLSWASSHLEGNTYSRLDTRELIEHGRTAIGKDAIETQMILNHKAAIELLVEDSETVGFDLYTLTSLHGLLAENLLPDQDAIGRLRQRPVQIAGSVYLPLAIPQLIEQHVRSILDKAGQITDPFEQSLFVLVQLPYLQPFEDVNKRVSRLAANIPMLKHNLCPLTFLGVPETAYVQATLSVYELNRTQLLRDLFIWAYERSTQEYLAVHKSLVEPDPFRLRYRRQIHDLVGQVIRACVIPALPAIDAAARSQIPAEDQERFMEVVLDDIKRLHEGVLARYRLRPSEFAAWQAVARSK